MTPLGNNHSERNIDRVLNVLIVDDSAVVRQVLTALLSHEGGMNVTAAANPVIAMSKMERSRPDVIILDLEMPRMHGLTFLQKIMSENPIPVVICSSNAAKGTEAAFRALEQGAVGIVSKPQVGIRGFLEESAVMLIDTVKGAAQSRVKLRAPASTPIQGYLDADIVLPPARTGPLSLTMDKVVAVGASTGGTEALRVLLGAMPENAPGLVIVQHMPQAFTGPFAARMNELSTIEVKEAANGDQVRKGLALIAPGNKQTLLRTNGLRYEVEVVDGPLVSRHRPSVNVLFRSVAQAAGPNSVGVIMTGMGNDGADGMLEMKQAGARTIAQDESSCVVFGMPKEAIARGAVDEVLALEKIPSAVLRHFQNLRASRFG